MEITIWMLLTLLSSPCAMSMWWNSLASVFLVWDWMSSISYTTNKQQWITNKPQEPQQCRGGNIVHVPCGGDGQSRRWRLCGLEKSRHQFQSEHDPDIPVVEYKSLKKNLWMWRYLKNLINTLAAPLKRTVDVPQDCHRRQDRSSRTACLH